MKGFNSWCTRPPWTIMLTEPARSARPHCGGLHRHRHSRKLALAAEHERCGAPCGSRDRHRVEHAQQSGEGLRAHPPQGARSDRRARVRAQRRGPVARGGHEHDDRPGAGRPGQLVLRRHRPRRRAGHAPPRLRTCSSRTPRSTATARCATSNCSNGRGSPASCSLPSTRHSRTPVCCRSARPRRCSSTSRRTRTRTPSVAVDEQRGGALAASHVIERGARRILFVGGPLFLTAVGDRYKGASAEVGPGSRRPPRAARDPRPQHPPRPAGRRAHPRARRRHLRRDRRGIRSARDGPRAGAGRCARVLGTGRPRR